MESVEKIAEAVLYEGYILYPYRQSALKNQKRWTFGGVYPRAYSESSWGDDSWLMQSQVLVTGDEDTRLDVKVRFLQVADRDVGRYSGGALEFVEELEVGGQVHRPWEEAIEREMVAGGLTVGELLTGGRRLEIGIPGGSQEEPLTEASGETVGAIVRGWRSLEGMVEIAAEPLGEGLFRLTVRITNSAPWEGEDRETTLKQTFVSTHTIMRVEGGEFVSLLEPPEEYQEAVRGCENVKTWPVLVGEGGQRDTLLSSPIILYDYPQVAPESPGNLFDGGEIDELLTLSIMTMTDEEKEEMRKTDPRSREILERTENLSAEELMNLHGTMRNFRSLREENAFWEQESRPAPESVAVDGVEIGKGSRVLLHPSSGRDIMDIALAGKVAIVEKIEQDFEEKLYIAVTLEDDPGREMGEEGVLGHRFFFSPEEVIPLDVEPAYE